ncbi:MAG TPA: response regulator [Methylomirabilota bacterium]|nr:response regulator [Methylomirabilota bacterium]
MNKRKTILFVDDDEQFLDLLQPYMERLSRGEWEIIVATNSSAALGAVDSRHVDLAVVDVRMPVIDGVQLLQLLNRKHPQLKKAVLSGYMDEAARSMAFNSGGELVLEKPVDAAGYESLFAALNELVHLQAEQGFRGVLRRVGLEDIIQMECLSRHSLIMEVTARGNRGRIYIREGSLVHAEFGEIIGEPALQELFTLGGGEFHHRAFTEPPRETLEGSWEFLLMEAVRKRDEVAGEKAAEEAQELARQTSSDNASEPAAVLDRAEAAPTINEMMVCSETGEALFATHPNQAQVRCDWFLELVKSSVRIAALLPVGDLERVEFVSAPGRMIVRLQDGHGVFLHANDN